MLLQRITMASITSLGLAIGIATNSTVAQIHDAPAQRLPHPPETSTSEFRRIDRPLGLKGVVTAAGLGLIGLELWWFLGSKPKSRSTQTHDGIQVVTINETSNKSIDLTSK
jgi:plastocyanin domain-containing protein